MSDYEGEWEPIIHRGNVFAPVKQLPVPPNPAHNYIVPKGRTLEEAERAKREKKTKSQKSSTVTLPRDYRQTLQSFKPTVASAQYSSQDARAKQPIEHVQKKVQSLPAHQRYKQNFDHPDGMYTFTRSIKNITNGLPKQPNLLPAEVFRDQLATICIDTHAFIALSETNDFACNIWGEPNHVTRAREGLHAFELSLVDPNRRQKTQIGWQRVNAFDGREQHRQMNDDWKSLQRQFFHQETDANTFSYQAHLYWPDGYDLSKFIDDYKEDVLQDLMDKYHCIINQPAGAHVIKIACNTQQILFQVYNRLMGLTREMVAKQKPGLYATHCQVPGPLTCKDRVQLVNVLTSSGRINMPNLTGGFLPNSEHECWMQLSSDINKKYRLAAKNALRSCVKGLHISRKYLRLRVIFGNFGFLQVAKADENPRPYHIGEFLEKVEKSGTQVLQLPLEEGKSFRLIDNIDKLQEFQPLDISWEVWFDFSGGLNKRLQLLKEYVPNTIDPDEPSVVATRWLTSNDASLDDHPTLLSINHIDLEKCGYHLHLGARSLFQAQKTSQGNDAFEKNIKFRPSLDGLRYDSTKHVIHPYGNQELTDIREVTIAKYRFKETQGTFEIRRTDHFNGKPGQSSPIAHRTEWTATYYYAGWDNLLSDLANIDPGQDVEWKRDLQTFFPKIEDIDNPQVLPLGWKTFMKEVDEIQTLISGAVGISNPTNNTGATTNTTKKINETTNKTSYK